MTQMTWSTSQMIISQEWTPPELDAEQDDQEDNQTQPPTVLRRSTRTRRPVMRLTPNLTGQTYEETNHLNAQSIDQVTTYSSDMASIAASIIMNVNEKAMNNVSCLQVFSIDKGIKVFGDKGAEATHGKISQMHERGCFQPVNVNDLTADQRKEILNIMTFIIEKRDGVVKARSVAVGSKQRLWENKEETASPMVSLEVILLTCVMDAFEN